MRIGLVLPDIPVYSETFFKNKILGLKEKKHEVILFVNNSKSENNYLNCKIVKAPSLGENKLKTIINGFLQLLKIIFVNPKKSFLLFKLNKKDGTVFKKNIKQIVSNQFLLSERLDWLHFGFGTMALGRENIAVAIGAKMAVSFRGYDYYVYPIKNRNCYSLLFSKEVKYHVLSYSMKKGLVRNGVNAESIMRITPAIDTNLFKVSEKKTENPILQIKTVSRLHPIKGLDGIIEALALLKNESIVFHFSVIGDGTEKERLKSVVYRLGLSENVSFLGKLSPEKVKEELSNTDIYLQYSIQEGFCNAVLEAQSMGLLCIVSDAEGLSENVLDNQTGWVIPKKRPDLLALKIKEVIHLEFSKKEIIKSDAIKRVLWEFNLEKQKQAFLEFYK